MMFLSVATMLTSCNSNPARQKTGIATDSTETVPASEESSGGGYKVYGNWCGPNHPLDELMDIAPGPIDQLDAECMIHDYCYAEKGYLDCACDENLTNELKRQLASHDFTTEQALVARGIHNYFIASPCRQSKENPQAKTAASRSMYRLYNGTKRRVTKVWDWATDYESEDDVISTKPER